MLKYIINGTIIGILALIGWGIDWWPNMESCWPSMILWIVASLWALSVGVLVIRKRRRELRLDKEKELQQMKIREAKIQESTCPSCDKLVGWHELPLKESSQYEYKGGKALNPLTFTFGLLNGSVLTKCKYKECPLCGYREEVKE